MNIRVRGQGAQHDPSSVYQHGLRKQPVIVREQIRTATRFESFELRVRCDANEYTNNDKTDTIKFSM